MALDLSWLDELPDLRVALPEPVQSAPAPVAIVPSPAAAALLDPKPAGSAAPASPGWGALARRPGEVGRWATLIAARADGPEPAAIGPIRWRQLLDDAAAFLSTWGTQAVGLGWTEAELFAVSPGPEQWLNRSGLVASLRGRPVLAITADAVTIGNPLSGPNRFYHTALAGAVPLWAPDAFRDPAAPTV